MVNYKKSSNKIQHKAGTYVIENSKTHKKYVGRSSDISKRLKQHNSGTGAKWTHGEGNWNVVKTYAGNDNITENNITRGVMRNEGIVNVRGGSYCKEYYPTAEFRAIKKANGFTNYGNQNNSNSNSNFNSNSRTDSNYDYDSDSVSSLESISDSDSHMDCSDDCSDDSDGGGYGSDNGGGGGYYSDY